MIHACAARERGQDRQGSRPAVGDVRLRRRPAVQDTGPRLVLDGVRLLRGGPDQRGQGDHREGDGGVSGVDASAASVGRAHDPAPSVGYSEGDGRVI